MSQVQNQGGNKITCLYVRTSTNDQKTGLESQIRTLREHCEKMKYANVELFADEGISGIKSTRPGLDRMMDLVHENKVDRVIVYSFSRYARSVSHLLSALEDFRKHKVSFTSYTEAIDTNSPFGEAFFGLVGILAQLERSLIIERVKNGLKNAKSKGIHIGRKKTRPSALIRQLLKKGLPYRTIGAICGTSSGSINAERKEMLKEEADETAKKEHEMLLKVAQAEKIIQEQAQSDAQFSSVVPEPAKQETVATIPAPLPTVTVSSN